MEAKKRMFVILVRSRLNTKPDVRKTLDLLRLFKLNHGVFITDSPIYKGMLKRIQPYVAFGEPSAEMVAYLLEKRGRLIGNKRLTEEYLQAHTSYKSFMEFAEAFMQFNAELKDIPGLKPVFRLHPPKGGHNRKGIKYPYHLGGATGNYGNDIDSLIKKMA